MRTKMFNFFKKKEEKETFSVVFCDTNDASTAFHTYGIFDTYEAADHVIRMAWHKTKDQKINDGYQVDDAWIVIKKNSKKVAKKAQ